MNYKVLTESGSNYEINNDTKRWARLTTTEKSGSLRTAEGDILNHDPITPTVGESLIVLTNNINPSATHRLLVTSLVISFEVF
jgi:hypothetical protein